jgi:hypothetical protein
MSGADVTIRIDSKKHGIDLTLAIDHPPVPTRLAELAHGYVSDVVPPAAAHGTLATAIARDDRPFTGWAAIVHTSTERPEGELIRRRDELLARGDAVAFYAAAATLADGTRRNTLVVRGPHGVRETAPSLELAGVLGGNASYPVARSWQGRDADMVFSASLDRELLRVNPLDVLPQPFRLLLSLGGTPQRVWAEARVTLDGAPDGEGPAQPTVLHGIAVSTFARPER